MRIYANDLRNDDWFGPLFTRPFKFKTGHRQTVGQAIEW
jgi:hypothetical protein